MTRFSTKLRRLMDEQGATIRSVAAKTGLREEDIYEYLQTRKVPKGEATRKLARALGTSPAVLFPVPPPPKLIDAALPGRWSGGIPHRLRPHLPVRGPAPAGESPLERAERRQKALIGLLTRKGILSKEEWEAKLADVIARGSRKPR